MSLVVPWQLPARGDPRFVWSALGEGGRPADRVAVLVLAVAALVTLCAAALPMAARVRAGAVALVGMAGLATWFLVDPPRLVTAWAPGWRLVLLTVALWVTPAALVTRRRAGRFVATAGAAAVLAIFLVPRENGRPLVSTLGASLASTDPLTWPQTATLVWMFVLLAAAAASLAVWRIGRALALAIAVVWIVWPALLLAFADLFPLLQLDRATQEPAAFLVPLHLLAYAALGGWGIVELTDGPR